MLKFTKSPLSLISLTFLFVLLFSGCTTESPPTPTPLEPQTLAPTSTYLPTIPQPTATATQPLPLNGKQSHYQIDLTLNYYNNYADISQTITYTNKTAVDLSDMLLVINPLYFDGSFSLKKLSNGFGEAISNFSWEGVNLRIPLAQPLKPEKKFIINIEYSLRFSASEGTYGVVGRQLNLANWYPFIPPYDENSGWQVHQRHIANSFIVGEYLVYEPSDFDVTLRFTDRQENFEVAASTPAKIIDGMYHYHLDLARTFVFSISDSYVISETEKNGITVISYVFPGHESASLAANEMALQAIALFEELYAPYPRDLFTIVEAEFVHNMEYDGLVFLSNGIIHWYDGTPKSNLPMLVPHETSHQWFFSLVGNNQALEPWLDEAFATYSEVLYYQRYHPEFVQWWWDNRVNFFNPQGYIDEQIYFADGWEPYRNTVYLQGARFLEELRSTIGDEAFFSFLKDYVESNSYQIATREDFFNLLNQHTQVDISTILSKYFKNP